MAIIVKHKATQEEYILLGTGFGAYKASKPGLIGGSLFPDEEEGTYTMMTVSDYNGNIHWMKDTEFLVIEIDGIKMKEFKSKKNKNR